MTEPKPLNWNQVVASAKDAADRADEASAKAGRTPESEKHAKAADQAWRTACNTTDLASATLLADIAEDELEKAEAEAEAERTRAASFPE